jgi:hypothetical protein
MQLRYLQTLTEVGSEQNSTIVFPMPIDLIKAFPADYAEPCEGYIVIVERSKGEQPYE